MKKIVILILGLCCANFAWASPYFEMTPELKTAYEKVLSLRIQEAQEILATEYAKTPDNLFIDLVADYCDFFVVFIKEEQRVYEQLYPNKDKRLKRIAKQKIDSPYFLYSQADIRLHWALLHIRFGEYYSAFREVNKAFKLLNTNQKRYPGFMPNLKDLGILHAAVGTIPDNYRWGLSVISSMEGTIEQGRKEIEQVLDYAEHNDFLFGVETEVLYAFLMLHLGNQGEEAWNLINTEKLQPNTNPLHCFVVANIAMRTERNDEAISLLEHQPRGQAFLPMPYLDFMLGTAKLRRLDKDADQPMLRWVNTFRGRHFIKEGYQKLAWHALVFDSEKGYKSYMQKCLSRGIASAGGDSNALKEAKEGVVPNLILLKARLLFDGAYYEKAFQLLDKNPIASTAPTSHQLEYTYRKGRILHGAKRYKEAIMSYEQTIIKGEYATYFYACNAALQIGKIYERQGNRQAARQYYKKCLTIKPDEYRAGLHQQAKAGLNRLSK